MSELAQEREGLVDFLIDNQSDVDTQERISAIDQERFNWLEYIKLNLRDVVQQNHWRFGIAL